MSRRQDVQSAEGVALEYRAYGVLQYISKTAPVGGEIGYAPGASWIVPAGTSTLNASVRFVNIGSNGLYTGANTQNPKAVWLVDDASNSANIQFGGSTGSMLASGNIFRTALTVANGRSASATGADKIVDYFAIPASIFDVAGRILQVTIWGTFANNANAKRVKAILGATNVTPLTNGTVTVTGGTVIGDSGSITTTGGGGWMVQCQLMKTGAAGSNTQESMTTAIVFAATHGGMGTWTDATFTESSAFNLALTLNCTTTATDLVYQGSEVTGFN